MLKSNIFNYSYIFSECGVVVSYKLFNEIIDIDDYIVKIKEYNIKFKRSDKLFAQCKNEEQFERNVERAHPPELSYKICRIYGDGRDTIISIIDSINEYTDHTLHTSLKGAIQKLEEYLVFCKKQNIIEYKRVEDLCNEINYDEWSVSTMIRELKKVDQEIDEILILINALKGTKTYRFQNGELTMAEIEQMSEQSTIHNNFSGVFNQSQVATGNHNSNVMNVNQSNDELVQMCSKMIEIINQSSEKQEVKVELSAMVKEIETAEGKASIKEKYDSLISKLSNHITVLGAFASTGIISEFVKFIA